MIHTSQYFGIWCSRSPQLDATTLLQSLSIILFYFIFSIVGGLLLLLLCTCKLLFKNDTAWAQYTVNKGLCLLKLPQTKWQKICGKVWMTDQRPVSLGGNLINYNLICQYAPLVFLSSRASLDARKLHLKMNGQSIEQVLEVKYLSHVRSPC